MIKKLLKAVQKSGKSLEFASLKLKNDKEIVLNAIKNQYVLFQNLSDDLKNDIVLQIVQQNGMILEHLSSEFQEAVKENGNSLQYASKKLRKDKEIVLKVVQRNGMSLEHASKKLKGDKEVVLIAVQRFDHFLVL